MMKRLFNYLLFALFLVLPLSVNAASASLSISCPSKANPGDTVSCTLKATNSSAGDINGFQGNFNFSNGLIYVSFVNSSSVTTASASDKAFLVGNINGFAKSVTLATLKVKIPSNATKDSKYTVSITDIIASDSLSQRVYVNSTSATIGIKSTVNTLKSLTVTGATFSFDPNKTEYNLTIDKAKVTINATKTDSSSSVSGLGEKTLKYGKNTFKVVVTSESGAKRTYTINITRPQKETNNNTSGNTSGSSNNTSTNTTPTKSSNNKLNSLNVNGKAIKLTDTTSYNVTLDNSVTELKLQYKTENSKATVKVEGDTKLKVGVNTFTITVTAENGSKKVYTLKVTRLEEEKQVSSNNYLKTLLISGSTIDFNKEKQEYTVTINNQTTLDINATTEDEKATYQIVGNTDLKDGSKVSIIVTAEDGSTREYVINVVVANDLVVPIIIGIVCLMILIVLIIVIYKSSKKEKSNE